MLDLLILINEAEDVENEDGKKSYLKSEKTAVGTSRWSAIYCHNFFACPKLENLNVINVLDIIYLVFNYTFL